MRDERDLPSQEDGQELCLACGMCCRGDLYRNAGLRHEEVPTARSLGLTVIGSDSDRPAFQLPCRMLDGTRCTIYLDERKPRVCSSFECKLLKRFLRGEIGLEPSLEHIRRARSLIDGLRAELGREADAPLWNQLTEWADADDGRKTETKLRVGQLFHLLSKVFLPAVEEAETWPPTLKE